jgi:nicotinate dehydrogenase subunit B
MKTRPIDGRRRSWSNGQPAYPILRFSDIPEIDIELIDNPNEPTLGLGEASVGPTGAAIGNALARALGKRVRDLPLTRAKIMATLLAE